MSIEKDIQQQSFRNGYQKAVVNILFSANWLTERIKEFLQEERITPQQYNILRILKGNKKPLSTLQIRARMLDKMSDTSRIVDRLLIKGLVQKKISCLDKRLVDVSITEQGLKLIERLDKLNATLDGILKQLNEDEVILLNQLLDKMRAKELFKKNDDQ